MSAQSADSARRRCEASISGDCLLITQGFLIPMPCLMECELDERDHEGDSHQ